MASASEITKRVAVIAVLLVFYEVSLICCEREPDPCSEIDYAAKAQGKFSSAFLKIVREFDKIDADRVIRYLALSHEHEVKLLAFLEQNYAIDKEHLQEILFGAHVLLDDGGAAYTKWISELAVRYGISSHHSADRQYRMRGALIKELLFSVREENQKTYTWFQLENHPFSFGYILRHAWDYLSYKWDGLNRGPEGCSKHTHHQPLHLLKKKAQ